MLWQNNIEVWIQKEWCRWDGGEIVVIGEDELASRDSRCPRDECDGISEVIRAASLVPEGITTQQ